MQTKAILSSKITIAVLLVVLAFFCNLKYKQWQQHRDIEKLKKNLLQQADTMEKRNQDLASSITYLNSDDFKEQVARQQLNLKKDGEVVYTFTQNPIATSTPILAQEKQLKSNPLKWWGYFFGNN